MKLNPIRTVTLHPLTLKALKKGHPWVTADKFSKAFPKEFLLGTTDQNLNLTFIHDPTHPDVLARLWSITPKQYSHKDFERDLSERVYKAIEKRKNLNLQSERDNFYLIFGEGDQLPGLHVIKLGQNILIQIYAFCWKDHFIHLINLLNQALKRSFDNSGEYTYWMQNRTKDKEIFYQAFNAKGESTKGIKKFIVSEYDIQYQIEFSKTYDYGIYTDMSAIRSTLREYFSGNVLNLFSYTGAFSLYALKQNAQSVTSVDLSPQYLQWLSDNIVLNPTLEHDKHLNVCASVDQTVSQYIKEQKQFDCIICDPPSFSSDGKKSTSAFDQYPKRIEQLSKLLAPNGTLILFLNTHSINMAKFDQMAQKSIEKLSPSLSVVKKLSLSGDCPVMPSFPEGNYLKGLVLKKAPLA